MIKALNRHVLFIVRLQEVILDLVDPKYVSVSANDRCPLWEVKNAVFERRNRRDHSLCPLIGGVRLREVSVSGGSTVV